MSPRHEAISARLQSDGHNCRRRGCRRSVGRPDNRPMAAPRRRPNRRCRSEFATWPRFFSKRFGCRQGHLRHGRHCRTISSGCLQHLQQSQSHKSKHNRRWARRNRGCNYRAGSGGGSERVSVFIENEVLSKRISRRYGVATQLIALCLQGTTDPQKDPFLMSPRSFCFLSWNGTVLLESPVSECRVMTTVKEANSPFTAGSPCGEMVRVPDRLSLKSDCA